VVQVNLVQMRTHQFFTQLMRLSGNPFQPVLVMQSAEDRSANNLTIVRQLVPVAISRGCESFARVRNSRSQARMWAPLIIVGNPLFQDSSHVPFVQRDEEIKTFPSNRAHEPFTKRIRLRRPKRSPQDDDAQRLQGAIQFRRVDASRSWRTNR